MVEDLTEEYLTYESRLASFRKTTKKRGSSVAGRGPKALNWPHKSIAPESLARAGLFYSPSPESPDNVVCFLCQKRLDGWEENDDPLIEHLKHAPECGWAVVAAIEAGVDSYALEDPTSPYMKDARKSTFAGRWPHENKKGWKCKTKQLVDAGWKYTPTSDSDDMATCVYCELALDGWEPGDKPLDEHYKRSPDCMFFALVEEAKTAKKNSRSKGSRTSKASRLSVQSVATVASETSIADTTTNPEDSVMSTASTMAQGGKKGRRKKATTVKSRKPKAKKEEAPSVHEIEASADEAPSPQPTRGRKRGSVAVDDSTMSAMEAPASKKRATRKQEITAVDDSVLEVADDSIMTDVAVPKKTGGRKKAAVPTRVTSAASQASTASVASLRGPPDMFPDDDEIERQLEADLERPLSDDEDITADSDSERINAQNKKAKDSKPSTQDTVSAGPTDYDMFDPAPVEADDAEVEDELRALQAEMEVDVPQPAASPDPEPEPQLQIPKKERKTGTRKASKQTKTKKAKAAPEPVKDDEEEKAEMPERQPEQELGQAPVPEPEPEQESAQKPKAEPEVDSEEPAMDDASLLSTGTVVKNTASARSSMAKRGRGRPSKASLLSQEARERPTEDVQLIEAPTENKTPLEPEKPAKRGRGRPSKASLASRNSNTPEDAKPEPAPKRGRGRPSKKSIEARKSMDLENSQLEEQIQTEAENAAAEALERDDKSAHPAPSEEPALPSILDENSSRPVTSSSNHPTMPQTPGHVISPAPSARQAVISPSQSPQSSDAENQPPSSKANTSAELRNVNEATTPTQSSSPSKRNLIGGLQSEVPWNAVDLDAILGSPQKHGEKEKGIERFLKQGQNLTSPEKRMTVDEWIYYNAGEAEKKLKHDCEAMVGRFESEGTKAMRVLEGLVVE